MFPTALCVIGRTDDPAVLTQQETGHRGLSWEREKRHEFSLDSTKPCSENKGRYLRVRRGAGLVFRTPGKALTHSIRPGSESNGANRPGSGGFFAQLLISGVARLGSGQFPECSGPPPIWRLTGIAALVARVIRQNASNKENEDELKKNVIREVKETHGGC